MNPSATRLQAAFGPASGIAPLAASRPAWWLWFMAVLLLATGLAMGGNAAAASGVQAAAPQLSAGATAWLDGTPPAPLPPPLHHTGIAESDGESGRIAPPTALPSGNRPAACGLHVASACLPLAASTDPVRKTANLLPPGHAPPAFGNA